MLKLIYSKCNMLALYQKDKNTKKYKKKKGV